MPQNFATAPSNSVSGAVLVTGSGPNVRWGTDGRTELFFDVSVALASKGIAVLVFDKRTCSGAIYPVSIPNPFPEFPCTRVRHIIFIIALRKAVGKSQHLAGMFHAWTLINFFLQECANRKFCTPVAVGAESPACSACPGCVNVFGTSVDDFVVDASAAMQFLGTQARTLNPLP